MNRLIAGLLLAAALHGAVPDSAQGKIRIVSSTTDLGSIASRVGGDLVEVQAIARPNSDVHRVEALPSHMVRVSRARLYLKVGLGLDGWADPIIDGSRNDELTVLDCSAGLEILEKPEGKVDASMGDVHPGGNPHYWLDPRNGAIVASSIAEALSRIDPANAPAYRQRAERFAEETEKVLAEGQRLLADIPSRDIVSYHASWVYLARAFDLNVRGTIEPIPGIPPPGRHLRELVDLFRRSTILAVLQEPYFSDEAGAFLAREAGARIVKISPSCDTTEPDSYLAHFDTFLRALAAAE
ncbi:MAG: zinc ABC transporter substrate-binding protein [Candidatus Eisenbacteria bacterium]|nr:zinc ABC transporter substrate-binding protein [Candidatus Eisenbacteria bacterium]